MTAFPTQPLDRRQLLHDGRLNVPVRELMTPGVVSVVEDASLHDAFRAMSIYHVHAVLVLARDSGRPLGWLTSHGLLNFVDEQAGGPPRLRSAARAREAITGRPVYVWAGATATEAAELMLDERVSHLIVGTGPDAPPEGVISDYDLARLASL